MKSNDKYTEAGVKINKNYEDVSCLDIGKIYDLAIQACDAKDTLKVRNVINTLKGLINCQYNGIASGFYRLYDSCLQFVNDKRFDKAGCIFYELHQSWNVAVVTNLNNVQNHIHSREQGVARGRTSTPCSNRKG
ncbi:MAG: hypothetical protein ACUZ8O_05145 [Candidatus Anammoxibacter sp.]